jgi:hypothetical protein
MVAVAPGSVLTLSPAFSAIPSFPLLQLVVPGFSIRTLPPTIDNTVKGEKAATFVAHEDIPRIKENKTGTKNTILANEERLNSISVLPFDLIIVLKIKLPVLIIDLMVKITTGKKNSSFNYNYTRRLI